MDGMPELGKLTTNRVAVKKSGGTIIVLLIILEQTTSRSESAIYTTSKYDPTVIILVGLSINGQYLNHQM
jgi:hypothetical protein